MGEGKATRILLLRWLGQGPFQVLKHETACCGKEQNWILPDPVPDLGASKGVFSHIGPPQV